MRHTHFATITSINTRRAALAILALALALFSAARQSAKRATTNGESSANSATKLRGREALDYLKQQGVYDSLEAININSAITQVKQIAASDGAANDEFGYAVAVDGDTLVVGAYQDNVGANNNQGSAYIFSRHQGGANNWGEVKKLTASDGAANNLFGNAVSVDGDTIVVGAYLNNAGGNPNQGAAYVFSRNQGGANNWGEVKKLIASDGATSDFFGWTVALDGDTIVAGALGASVDANGDQGTAYVFSRNQGGANNWGEVKKLIAADGAVGDNLGYRVALDGDTIVVGARGDDVGANLNQGSAYVFSRNQGGADNWGEVKKLTASDGAANDFFGYAVSVDGDTLVVGAYLDDVGANLDQGAAYVFSRNQGGANNWGEVKKLTAADGVAGGFFGNTVAVDGDSIMVGAEGTNAGQGAAFVFSRNQGGANNWGQVKKLTALDGAVNHLFGSAVAVDGDTLVVGAHRDDVGANADQGSAYLFSGLDCDFTEQAHPVASDGAASDQFGRAVAVEGDTLVVGASGGDDKGSAYVFSRNQGGAGVWGQVAKLTASDGVATDQFGTAVAVDGDTIVVGTQVHDVGANSLQGAVYVYSRNQGGANNWGEVKKLLSSDGAAFARFGVAMAVDGDTLVVGAWGAGNAGQGAAYVFSRNQGGANNWGEVKKLTASDGATGDSFGWSVAVDGDVVVVAAYADDTGANEDQGSAYVYSRNQGGANNWGEVKKLTASDGAASDNFGWFVAADGDTIVVGVPGDNVGGNGRQGSAYVFSRNQGGANNWGEVKKLTALDGAAVDRFGWSVAVDGDTLVIGAITDDVGANDSQGSAYVYNRNQGGANNWGQSKQLLVTDGQPFDNFGNAVSVDGDTIVVGALFDQVGANSLQGSAYVYSAVASCVTPPTITAGGPLTRQAGSPAVNSTVATVSDAFAGTLSVSATTVPTGLSVMNIVNTSGTVTAEVAADCMAASGANTVGLTVTNQTTGLSSMANLTVNVTAAAAPTTANAGPDQSLCATAPATLAANTPSVGTGAWSIVSGPSLSTAQFNSLTNPAATFTPAGGAGAYTLRWTITGACATSTDDVVLTYNTQPTITLGASPAVFPGTTSANLPYTATTGSPNQYDIDYNAAANTAGFVDVINVTLAASPIVLVVPGAATSGVYNATLTVRNNTTGCVSSATAFTVTISTCPSQFTVNDPGDAADASAGNGVCATAGGVCTLRAALQEANALTACTPLTINFSVTGTITLGSALPAIAHPNLTINGPGAANLTVSGNNLYRVLSIASGSYNVSISGLTLANGYIKAADTTAMSGTNQAPDGLGGGLYSLSTGTVNVTDCAITNNTAQGGNATGGTNAYGGDGRGAGIYLQGSTAKLTRCTISNNSALGGLAMGGTTQTLDGTGIGGGIHKTNASLTVEDCTIANNITDRIAGSVLSSFTAAQGAGLYNGGSGALSVTGSTFSGNRRPNTLTLQGAAITNQASNITWTLTNSTFSGNIGSNTIAHIQPNGTLTMVNCTVANNTLSTTNTAAGAISVHSGSILNLKNTILGNNSDGPNIRTLGTVTSQGNNFDSDGTTGFTDGVNGDIVGTSVNKIDPLLSILGNYGGLTQTQALLPGSPAINAGTSSGAPATDQRGITRVGNTDIGAFESRGFTLAIAGGNNQSAVTSTAFANPLAVLVASAFSEPVNGGQVTFTLPGSGPSANLANNPATITGGTATTGTVTANAVTGGSYPVAATTNGAPAGVNFFLTNTCQTITVSPATLAGNATTGQTFTQTFTQMNGTGAITWSLIGTAPPGLSFDAMTATLSGSPSASGSFSFTVRATDGNNCFGERQYTLGVDCQTVTLSPMEPALAGGTAGTPYSQSFTAAGGALPHNFSVSGGTLPTGLMLAANGALTGTPTAFGNFNFTVRATDANECFGERAYTVRICGVISLTVSLPNGTTGVAYSQTITASGGAPPSSFAVTAGSLPPGLSLNGDGTLSGTPTQSGSFTFTVTATDPLGCTGSQNYIVNIGCQTVTIDQTVLANGFAGTAYNQTLTATGGTAPYSFAVSGGALPGGINLSSGGALSGLPTTQATSNFTVRATDAYGCFGEQSFTVLISGNGLMFYPLPSPVRLLDTRAGLSPNACSQPEAPISGGTSRTQMARNFCGLPANAQAITGNITTVQSGGGYLTLYPSDAAQPLAANSNYEPNEILNNVFTVGLGAADGAFKIFVTSGTDIVIDVTGYYAPPAAGGLFFHPLPKPIRLLETRNGFTGCNSPAMPLPGGVETAQNTHLTCDGVTIPTTALAITGNATTVSPTGPGFPYLTLFPADAARPLVANSNYLPGQIMNAPFTVGLNAAGEFKIYPTTQTDLVIDVLGYFSPEALDANGAGLLFTPLGKPVRLLETRAGFAGCFATGTPLLAGSTQTQTARGICNGETVTATALGIVGNVTVVNAESGYLTFWPSTALQPTIATSNFSAGQIFNRHFTAGLGMSDGAFKIFTQSRTDLVIDVSGFFAP